MIMTNRNDGTRIMKEMYERIDLAEFESQISLNHLNTLTMKLL